MKRYTWRDWWKAHEGMSLFWVSQRYADVYPWWSPKRYKLGGKLHKMYYYFKCLLWKRWTTVTPRDLPPTWTDRDALLLHASFEIFLRFMEEESQRWSVAELEKEIANPYDEHTKAWCESYLPVAKEMEALYHWWTVERPAREAEYSRRLTVWSDLYAKQRNDYTAEDAPRPEGLEAARQSLNELDDHVRDAEDDAMLIRLIKIRVYLWT